MVAPNPTPPPYRAPHSWSIVDEENLDKTTKAQAVISALLGLILLVAIAGLVLGVVGYLKTADRLDNIENSTAHTAAEVASPPAGVIP